jgi:glutamine amidotransferase
MQELWKSHAGVPSIAELTLTLQDLARRIAPHGTFNFLLSNGEALWAHATTHLFFTERRHPFAQAHLADEDLSVDFASETTPDDRVAVVVTAPLTKNECWTPFEPGVVNVFVNGRLYLGQTPKSS